MKKVTVESNLEIKNDEPIVTVKGKEGVTSPEILIAYLRRGISNNKMKVCTPKEEKGYTTYKFKVYNDENEFENYFIIRVANKERYFHKQTIQSIKDIANISALIKKVNINRFIAGIAVSTLILTISGPSIAKGLEALLKEDYEYDQSRYRKFSTYDTESEEQKEEKIEDYYVELEKKVEAGDENAIREYALYVVNKHIEEQGLESTKKTR